MTKRREWWIREWTDSQLDGFLSGNIRHSIEHDVFLHPEMGAVHVREVLEGDVTISREELSVLIGEAMGFASLAWSETPGGIFDSAQCIFYLNKRLAELFGSLPERVGG